MSMHTVNTRQIRLLGLCVVAALSAVVIVERASATTTTDTSDCAVDLSGSVATLSWTDSGGTHVIRRDDKWLATAGLNASTYVDETSPPSAIYLVRTWINGTSFDRTCVPASSSTTTERSTAISTNGLSVAPPTDPSGCVVEVAGSTATLSWADGGGTHVIRRDNKWLATAGLNESTYVDNATPTSATYLVRTWINGTSFDRTCVPASSSTTTASTSSTPTTTTAPTTTTQPAPTTTETPATTTTQPAPTTTTQPAPTTTTQPAPTTTETPATTTAPPTTSTPTSSPSCTVTALLVPTCGAWLGAATTDRAVKYDYEVGLIEYEAVARNTPDIVHFYRSGGTPFPSAGHIAVAERPGQQRSLMLINWKPSRSHTWQQIANGEADANIKSVAAGIKKYPHKFFLTIWHEPENELGSAGSGMTPADYVAMYRHVVNELRSLGVTNVVYVWNMMGYSGHGKFYDNLYPGNDVVDWIASDPYGKRRTADMGMLVDENCCRVAGWPGFYTWATQKAPGKPLMLAEWGFDLRESDGAPAALLGGAALLRDQYPALKALVYWNENHPDVTARLDEPTALGRAYGEAYSQFANDDYFNQTSPAAAP